MVKRPKPKPPYIRRQTKILDVQKALLLLQMFPEEYMSKIFTGIGKMQDNKVFSDAIKDATVDSLLKALGLKLSRSAKKARRKERKD